MEPARHRLQNRPVNGTGTACRQGFTDLTEPGSDAHEVVPVPTGRLSLAVARCVAGTAALVRAERAVSDGHIAVSAQRVEELLRLEGRCLEVDCRGPDAVQAMRLAARQLRGLRGSLPPQAGAR